MKWLRDTLLYLGTLNDDLDLYLIRLAHWRVPWTGKDEASQAKGRGRGVTFAQSMILNVPPASGPHHRPSANLTR